MLGMLATESSKPVTFLSLLSKPGEPDFHEQTFARLDTLGPLPAADVCKSSCATMWLCG